MVDHSRRAVEAPFEDVVDSDVDRDERTYFGWAQEGRLRHNGMPRGGGWLLDWALLFAETQDFLVPAGPPLPVQRALSGLLAPIARRRGHHVR